LGGVVSGSNGHRTVLPPDRKAKVLNHLVTLVEELAPFLERSGQAYCRMPHKEKEKQAVQSLRSRSVRSLLVYRYCKEHKEPPDRDCINGAIDYCEGKLLDQRIGPTILSNCPVLRCFLRAIDDRGDGAGSAEDILKMLRSTNHDSRLLKGAERLPTNPTAMGLWLRNNQLILQSHGIELDRPPRGSTKRLWSWRQIIPDDDASDALRSEVSPNVSLPNPLQGNDNQADDTLLDQFIEFL
jgi:hypothetical protein